MAKTREKKLTYINDYNRNKTKVISIRLNTEKDAELIAIYQTIPNKREWLKKCLLEYSKQLGKITSHD